MLDAVAWWCSGVLGRPWTWEYQPLVGVWLLAGALGIAYAVALRRHTAERGEPAPATRHYAARFGVGLVLLVVSSEWPLGPLGAGYLASAAAVRTLLLTFGVAPLLLSGMPPWLLRRLLRIDRVRGLDHPVARLVRAVTLPWVAFLQFNALLVFTQLPAVVDPLKVTQLGSFSLDMLWLVSSLIMWVPLLRPLPELGELNDPLRLLYLFGLSVVPTVPASFLTFSEFPLYQLYELAPPVFASLDAVTDQQIAGLTLKIGGGLIVWTLMAVLFFRWAAREHPGSQRPVSWSRFERDLERYELRTVDSRSRPVDPG